MKQVTLLRKKNSDKIAEALEKLLKDKEQRIKFGKNGRKKSNRKL